MQDRLSSSSIVPETAQPESAKPDTATATPVVSKRAVQRLTELQHALSTEMRALSERHSRLLGALMACDATTQQAMMLEYRDQLHSVHAVIAKLRMVLERFCDEQ